MENIEKSIDYTFNNKKLLKQALTHSSVTSNTGENYERLEFLGDRILGVGVAQMLYEKFPNEPEGSLSQRHVCLVCKEAVAEVVRKLGIDGHIISADKEAKASENVLCDVGEAVIGAICIDSSVDNAIAFVRRNWEPILESYKRPPKDAKTLLQEVAFTLKLGNPEYVILEKSGAEHQPVFKIAVKFSNGQSATGTGHNKKLAEQEAAAKMLKTLGYENNGSRK